MKREDLPDEDVEMQGLGDMEVQSFDMEANADAFKTLYEKIYSYPIRAIVRELASNAYDSQKRAGCEDKPFYVKAPTRMNHEFYVRDYGEGITEDKMREVYAVIFNSDKRDTNDQVGAFGLGAKTPFAYTDQFVVQSYIDGTKTDYSIFIDESGKPAFVKTVEEVTDEPDGVRVKFSVEEGDHRRFHEAIEKELKFFEPKPEVTPELEMNLGLPEPEWEGEDWKVYDEDVELGEFASYARMGNVAYPISENIEGWVPNVLLDFDIGELSPEAAREGLSYSKRTAKNLRDKFEKMKKELSDKMADRYKDLDYFEACYEWISKSLPFEVPDPEADHFDGELGRVNYHFDDIGERAFAKISVNDKHVDTSNEDKGVLHSIKKVWSTWDDARIADWLVVCADERYCKHKKTTKFVREYVEENKQKYQNSQYVLKLLFIDEKGQEYVDDILDKIDYEEFWYTSELEKPDRDQVKVTSTDKAETDALILESGYRRIRECWETLNGSPYDEIPDEPYFVWVKRFKYAYDRDADDYRRPKNLYKKADGLSDMGLDPNPIVGLKPRYGDPPEGWKNFGDLYQQVIDYLEEAELNVVETPKFIDYVEQNLNNLLDPLFEEAVDYYRNRTVDDLNVNDIRRLCRKLDFDMSDLEEDQFAGRLNDKYEVIQNVETNYRFREPNWLKEEEIEAVNALYYYRNNR